MHLHLLSGVLTSIVFQWCFLCNILIFCVKMFSCVFFYKPLLQAVKRQISLFTLFYPWQIKFDIINTPNASPVCNTSRPQVCVNVQWKTSCTLALLQSPADHGTHLSQDDGGGGGGGGGFFLACQDVWRIFDNSFPARAFFLKVVTSSCTLIPLFRLGSVHHGSVS